MSFSYQVILRPSDIKYKSDRIPNKFDNGNLLNEVLKDVISGNLLVKDIPQIEVVWDAERWEWFALNSRRLWIFQELEKVDKVHYVSMKRVELVNGSFPDLKSIYKTVTLFSPEWALRTSNNFTDVSLSNSKPVVVDISSDEEIISSSKENRKKIEKKISKKNTLKSTVTTVTSTTSTIKTEEVEHGNSVRRINSKESLHSDERSIHSNDDDDDDDDRSSNYTLSSESSSLSRKQRMLSKNSGLFGYGYYHIYKTQYLDKLRYSRKEILRKYRPYNVNKSLSSKFNSMSSLTSDLRDMKFSNDDVFHKKSSCNDLSYSNRQRSDSYRSNNSLFDDLQSRSSASSRKRKTSEDDYRSVVPFRKRINSENDITQSVSVRETGISLSELYSLWYKRRSEYFNHHSGYLSITNGCAQGYLCGMCFKNFKHIVDLQQHCEELLHYACITCGKFFSTYAALGQHCKVLAHKKD